MTAWVLLSRALLALSGLAVGIDAQELVSVRRLNDSVSVRWGVDRSEQVLYAFTPTADLAAGDEIEQGSGGQSTLVLSTGGLVEMYSSGHLVIDSLAEAGDVLRFPALTQVELTSGLRKLTCFLPGGARCAFLGTTVTVRVEPGRMRIRNEGSTPVEIEGNITLTAGQPGGHAGVLNLMRGEEVHLPLFQETSSELSGGLVSWRGRALRHSGGFVLAPENEDLLVQAGSAETADVLTVGGVRMIPRAGQQLLIRATPRGRAAAVAAQIDPEAGPPGMITIGLKDYRRALKRGETLESLLAKGIWVPPSVRQVHEAEAAGTAHAMAAQQPSSEEGATADDEAHKEDGSP